MSDPEEPFTRRQYAEPPVIEAIARLIWAQPAPWTVTTPGSLFERVKGDYPGLPEARSRLTAGMSSAPNAPGTALEFTAGPQEMLYSDAARSRLLVVSPEALGVHGLPPYEGWESMEARLEAAYGSVDDLFEPSSKFGGVSLRYINRIELETSSIQFEDYLTIGFRLPPSFPTQMAGFLDRVDVVYPDLPIRMSFTWASVAAPQGKSAFVLDLDLQYQFDAEMDFRSSMIALRELKARETRAFEGLLTDRIREVFGEQH